MNETERFLDLYRRLEQIAISYYQFPADGTAVSRLEKLSEYKSVASELRYCREVRALLSHKPQIGGEYAVTPSEAMCGLLEDLIAKIEKPSRCIDVSPPLSEIVCADPDDKLLPLIRTMTKRGLSNLPILYEGRVVGILSAASVLSYQSNHGFILNESTPVRELEKYTSLSANGKKYHFMKSGDPTLSAVSLIRSRFHKGERVAMILLTENGTKNEKLLGILTPWDVMGI